MSAGRASSFVLLFTVILCDLERSQACLPDPDHPFEHYSMAETLRKAPIVVIGTDVHHGDVPYPSNWVRNNTFDVTCVLKSGGYDVESLVYLMDVGVIDCMGTQNMQVGKSFIVCLNPPVSSHQTYTVYEPAIMNTGAFEVTPEKLAVTSTLCGLDDQFQPRPKEEEPRDSGLQCPARLASAETCVVASGVSIVRTTGMQTMAVLMLSMILLV